MCRLENTVGTEQRGDPEKLTLENDQRPHSEQSHAYRSHLRRLHCLGCVKYLPHRSLGLARLLRIPHCSTLT